MGRPERPLDPGAGPVQRLAHDLRELRRAAGGPSYRAMTEVAGCSVTSLSEAAAGRKLPSFTVFQGYVRACGGDLGEWEPRWKDADAEAAGTPREEASDAAPPYRGLARFEPDDHALFFGRDRLVEEARELVCTHRFAVVFGASGSGKSSLLRAGLIPHLRAEIARRGAPAALRVLTPGARPAQTYGHLLTPKDGEPESWVVVDQFEEVFTLCRDTRERSHFIDLLLAARNPDSRLRVLIAVRADFYARCAEHRELADALRGAGLLVGPMNAEELREAVVGPAQAAGLLVERELTARIVDEVQDQPGALPMLSHALLETWRRRRSRMLTLAGYEAVGGVLGAIAATAEDVYGRLSGAQARTARQLLLRLIEPGQGNADTRRPLVRAELDDWNGDDVPVVVDRLAHARLVTVDEDGVQLAHEALITCWPRLRGWIEEDRERLRHHRRLTEAARAWLEHDRDPGALYRGSRLVRAEELFADDRSGLTAPECAFLTAALAAREAERRAVTRTARRSRTLIGALSAVLAVALLIGLAAWTQAEDNKERRTDDAARRIAEVADGLRTTDPRTAMLLGVAAWRVSPLPEARRALLGSLAQPERGTFTDPATADDTVRFLLDSGRTLLSSDGGDWRTWDLATGRRTASGRIPGEGADTLVTAGPGARVLAVGGTSSIQLWDTATRHRTRGSSLAADWTNVRFSPDGATFLATTAAGRVQLRSVADGRLLYTTHGAADLSDVASGPDGRLVALCPNGRAPQLWDLHDRRLVHGSWERSRKLCDENSTVVFGGGGGTGAGGGGGGGRFAVLSDTGRRPEGNGSTGTSGNTGLRVWDTGTGRQVADIPSLGVDSAVFSPDGALLATADDTEVRVWRLDGTTTAPVFRHALNNQIVSDGLSWVPGRRPALRYLEERTVHTLDLGPVATSVWRAHPADSVLLSPDGHTLATAERTTGANYRFRLLDTRDGHDLGPLPSPPAPVSDDPSTPVDPQGTLSLTGFSPDGTTFAYGISAPGVATAPQPITVWDVGRHLARTTLSLPNAGSVDVVVGLHPGPAGHRLYATRISDLGRLDEEVWDVARHRRTGVLKGLEGMPLAVRPDGRLLVGDNRAVRPPSGKVTTPSLVQGARIGALAFSLDGSLLAAGDWSGRVALWDGELRRSTGVLRSVFPTALEGGPEGVGALAVSPDRRTLAVAGDQGTLQLWDIPTSQPLGGTLTTPGDAITTLAFAPDSATLYAGSAHVPLQRYSIDPAGAVREVCGRAGGHGLTREQWRTYIPDAGFRRVCGT
ncbi:WD40 repeat domain-containing protein [Streptomyces turgidiscabies]|uniref:WD40 repeat domain-containing protein n=2 Tax=Streptomyces TaxID=1883 RepID=UPI00031EBB8B|nr:WD40 repeat domain-containing protein [Streptomyces turgidiscabies]MDX3492253.1 WD40 repeat domain-containing protein [Streptomyces turgidiscabies]GAQ69456.1 WD domain, G-beta repeat [Streptomyces turgidiscabies]